METSRLTIERIVNYLSEGKRFDGRSTDEFREIIIETGISKNAEGSARVKLGKTEVIVGVKLGLGEPYPDSPDAGNLMVTAELLPLSSDRFESGPPGIESIELARVIDRGIRESKFIDFKKLCITEGKKVWTVFVDIYSMNDDGNLLDAAGIGVIAAIKDAKMLKYDEEKEKVIFSEHTKDKLPLSKNVPFSLTMHKIGDKWIVDPTREEEEASESRLTVSISEDILYAMQKGNLKEISIKEAGELMDLAERVWKKVFPKIEKQIK
ncbi:MAG: exosome complex protein Rrp42 [Nanoarchaeota archaeon]|nr:exosome complex protein Rrp42 [Nanoarchaeota archaeon]